MNGKIVFTVLVSVLICGFLITGCQTEAGNNNNENKTSFGNMLKFSNISVYTYIINDESGTEYTRFMGSPAIENYFGADKYTLIDGIFNLEIRTPNYPTSIINFFLDKKFINNYESININAEKIIRKPNECSHKNDEEHPCFSHICYDGCCNGCGDDYTPITDNDIQIMELDLFLPCKEFLKLGKIRESELSRTPLIRKKEEVFFWYLDSDVIVTGKGKTFKNFTNMDFTLNLKKGWNSVYLIETVSTDPEEMNFRTIIREWSISNPSLRWIIEERN